MNMLLDEKLTCNLRGSCLILWLFLSLLSGCSNPDSGVNSELFAEDSTTQSLQRFFMPESYWQDKVENFSTAVEANRVSFQAQSQLYSDMLTNRRAGVVEAIKETKKSGGDPKKARQQVISAFRERLDPLRTKTRKIGKELRKKMVLLSLARQELESSR